MTPPNRGVFLYPFYNTTPYLKIPLQREKKFLEKFGGIVGIYEYEKGIKINGVGIDWIGE
jgi:hypothetical protein